MAHREEKFFQVESEMDIELGGRVDMLGCDVVWHSAISVAAPRDASEIAEVTVAWTMRSRGMGIRGGGVTEHNTDGSAEMNVEEMR